MHSYKNLIDMIHKSTRLTNLCFPMVSSNRQVESSENKTRSGLLSVLESLVGIVLGGWTLER